MMAYADRGKAGSGEVRASASNMPTGQDWGTPAQAELSEDDKSKDAFFADVAEMADAMITRHGKEFAIGTLVLAAKFIAEDRSLSKRGVADGEPTNAVKPG